MRSIYHSSYLIINASRYAMNPISMAKRKLYMSERMKMVVVMIP